MQPVFAISMLAILRAALTIVKGTLDLAVQLLELVLGVAFGG